MSQFSAAMLMSLIAGGATAIGSLMVMFGNKTNTRFLSFALGFSAGIMVYISIACLLPESVEYLSYELDTVKAGLLSIVFMLIGIALSAVIDTFVPEFENPHSLKKVEDTHDKNINSLYRVGVMSAVAIALNLTVCPGSTFSIKAFNSAITSSFSPIIVTFTDSTS